jgi:hypothetical protein
LRRRDVLGDAQGMLTLRTWTGVVVGATVIGVCAACDSSSGPAMATPPADCTFTVTMTSFTATPSPVQGTRYDFFFSSTTLAPTAAVFLVDVNAAPPGCTTAWTAVSANREAVQLSPAGGTARGQVELFIPANAGAARATAVTIAGQQAIVSQAGVRN